MKDRQIYDESNVWSTAQRRKKIYGFDAHVGFEWLWQTVFVGMVMS